MFTIPDITFLPLTFLFRETSFFSLSSLNFSSFLEAKKKIQVSHVWHVWFRFPTVLYTLFFSVFEIYRSRLSAAKNISTIFTFGQNVIHNSNTTTPARTLLGNSGEVCSVKTSTASRDSQPSGPTLVLPSLLSFVRAPVPETNWAYKIVWQVNRSRCRTSLRYPLPAVWKTSVFIPRTRPGVLQTENETRKDPENHENVTSPCDGMRIGSFRKYI